MVSIKRFVLVAGMLSLAFACSSRPREAVPAEGSARMGVVGGELPLCRTRAEVEAAFGTACRVVVVGLLHGAPPREMPANFGSPCLSPVEGLRVLAD